MSPPITQNFRGTRALVIHSDDANRSRLVRDLRKLGLVVTILQPDVDQSEDIANCDLIFFDADEGMGGVFADRTAPDVAYVAIIGNEAPSRLSRVVRQRCASHILKPIRSSGIFTAVFVAINEFQQRRAHLQELEAMRQRLSGRRIVTKAVLQIMAVRGVDEDEAYRQLRLESMNRRLPIDKMARESLSRNIKTHGKARSVRISQEN